MNSLWKQRVIGFALWFIFLGLPGALVSSLYPPASGVMIFLTVILPSLIGGFLQPSRSPISLGNGPADGSIVRATSLFREQEQASEVAAAVPSGGLSELARKKTPVCVIENALSPAARDRGGYLRNGIGNEIASASAFPSATWERGN